MALMTPPDLFAVEILKALGLKRVVKLVLTMEVGSLTTLDATIYPDEEELQTVLQKFTLQATPVLECGRADPETRP